MRNINHTNLVLRVRRAFRALKARGYVTSSRRSEGSMAICHAFDRKPDARGFACVLWPSDGLVFGDRLQIDFGAGLGDDDQDTGIGHEVADALRAAGLEIRGPVEGGEPLRVAMPVREKAVWA